MWSQLEMNVTKKYETISDSQNPTKTTTIHVFTPKRRSHSASSTYNEKKGIRCNFIPNMKALAPVLIEEKYNKRTMMVLYRSPDLRVIKEPLQIIFAYYRRIRKSYPVPGGHVFWHIIIPWKNLVEGYQRIFSVKLIWNWTIGFGVEDFHSFLYSHIRKTGPAHGRHVYWHIIILWATLVKVYPRIVSVKFFWNWTSSFGEEDFQSIYKENWPHPWRPCFLTYQNSLNNFGRGSPKDHFCEIILKLDQQFWRRRFSKFSI